MLLDAFRDGGDELSRRSMNELLSRGDEKSGDEKWRERERMESGEGGAEG